MSRSIARTLAAALLLAGACSSDAGVASVSPADAQAHDAPEAADVVELAMQLGTNPTGKTGPDRFTPIGEGDEVRIQWGFQGFYMAVFALRCDQGGPAPIWVEVKIVEDGEVLASVRLLRPLLEAGGDGSFYAWDLFVLTPDWESWVDRPVTLDAALFDDVDRLVGSATASIVVRAPSLFD